MEEMTGLADIAGLAQASDPPDPMVLIRFWAAAGRARWFARDAAFDDLFRTAFQPWHDRAVAGGFAHWAANPQGSLALLLLLDQFPRNAFRGTARMYTTDAEARAVATGAVASGHDLFVPLTLRVFMYLPFGHSEDRADQSRAVSLAVVLGDDIAQAARRHHDIVHRFGRFPHRNAILGRSTTPEEAAFLRDGGFAG